VEWEAVWNGRLRLQWSAYLVAWLAGNALAGVFWCACLVRGACRRCARSRMLRSEERGGSPPPLKRCMHMSDPMRWMARLGRQVMGSCIRSHGRCCGMPTPPFPVAPTPFDPHYLCDRPALPLATRVVGAGMVNYKAEGAHA
jgi:hypothetical protein